MMDKDFVKGGLILAGVGGVFALCSGILSDLLNRGIIKPKNRQQDTDLTMLCGYLAGAGGAIMGLAIGPLVGEAFQATEVETF